MIQQGRPFSSVSKFVHLTHRLEGAPANQIASAISSSLMSRYLEGLPDRNWSTVTFLKSIQFPDVNVKKCGDKVTKDNLAESSVLNSPALISLFRKVAENLPYLICVITGKGDLKGCYNSSN